MKYQTGMHADEMSNEELTRELVRQYKQGGIDAEYINAATMRGFDLYVLRYKFPPCPECGKPAGQSGLCGDHNLSGTPLQRS